MLLRLHRHAHHPGSLLNCSFRFSTSGVRLEVCMSTKLPDDTMLSVVADYPKTEQYKATSIYHLTRLQVQSPRAGVWEQRSWVILAWTFSGSDRQAGRWAAVWERTPGSLVPVAVGRRSRCPTTWGSPQGFSGCGFPEMGATVSLHIIPGATYHPFCCVHWK